jgi:hypothetical protein
VKSKAYMKAIKPWQYQHRLEYNFDASISGWPARLSTQSLKDTWVPIAAITNTIYLNKAQEK